jgi:tRNA pseudouridine(55) synthase
MIKAYKKIGQTPLEVLDELRINKLELKNEILSYAGRLDPIAEGEMIIMVGKEENCDREKFLKYDKTYEAEILFGFSTDTYDILGLVQDSIIKDVSSINLKKNLKKIKKIKEMSYPPFSSKTVEGKPLFQWYKEGRITEIKIPTKEIKIKKAKLLKTEIIAGQDLWNYVNFVVGEVKGDFRQKEILNKWHQVLNKNRKSSEGDIQYQVAKVRFKVTTGTYVRGIVNELSKMIENPACLLKLNRTKIHN